MVRAIECERDEQNGLTVICPATVRMTQDLSRWGWKLLCRVAAMVLSAGLMISPATAISSAGVAQWTIGRAVIQADPGGRGRLQVKLSLRNEGKPDQSQVQLIGRWIPAGQDPRKLMREDLSRFVLLGRFQRETAMKQTAIVTSSLVPLGRPPAGHVLELVVLTGAAITDQRRVAVAR